MVSSLVVLLAAAMVAHWAVIEVVLRANQMVVMTVVSTVVFSAAMKVVRMAQQ